MVSRICARNKQCDVEIFFISIYYKERGGGVGEAVNSPFYTVLYHSRKVGGVMCDMYGCERLGRHGPILVSITREHAFETKDIYDINVDPC